MKYKNEIRILIASFMFLPLLFGNRCALAVEGMHKQVSDEINLKWKTRAITATQKLSRPGLDLCDKALEHGFEQYQENIDTSVRIFKLNITIEGKMLQAAFTYNGSQLDSFLLSALPTRWLAVQKNNSKTLSILVNDANCAMDICTNNPFSDGPCLEMTSK